MDKAARRYVFEFSLAMTGYVVLMLASAWLLRESRPPALRVALAVMPVVPLLFAYAAYLRYLQKLDELQQRIQLMAHAYAAGITGLLTLTYGLLVEKAGLPSLSLIWVFPLLIASWGIASGVLSWKYR